VVRSWGRRWMGRERLPGGRRKTNPAARDGKDLANGCITAHGNQYQGVPDESVILSTPQMSDPASF